MFEIEFIRGEVLLMASGANDASGSKENKMEASPYRLRRDSHCVVKNILLRGQMRYLQDMDAIIFLCSPL